MNARLDARRANSEPKCATCSRWSNRDADEAATGECERFKLTTLDLSVCSAWELHEVHTGQILKPHEVIEDER